MTKQQTEALPEGMVPWAGGDAAPADWDGGPVLLRDSETLKPYGKGGLSWRHFGDDHARDIIAYTPKRATPSPAPSDTLERREALNPAQERLAKLTREDLLAQAEKVRTRLQALDYRGCYWDANIVQLLAAALSLPAREVSGERECGWCSDGRETGNQLWPDYPPLCRHCGGTGKEALATTPAPREMEAALESIARPFPDGCNWEDQARACQTVAITALAKLDRSAEEG